MDYAVTDPLSLEQHARLLRIIAEGIVRPSFARCCEHGQEIFDTFYASLADHVPGVGAMFANTDMQKQNALIRAGIATLIDYACGDAVAENELVRLGILHDRQHLDVPPAMYPGWVHALMEMVAEYDPQRTDTIEAGWREVLAPGITLIIANY
jgi:hemoglobin-like flavoprotein